MDLISSDFKKLAYHIYDENIEFTSNKLENCFKHIFGTAIKKLYKIEKRILKRFD